ncbi:hypothetical protein Pint_18341 [Pistacia integerrima]|uniref:Uncharacterized protein n=1 Tax=Pistacia integerrima TaxID=434235 RepID=A0ACC0YUG5_9ROSI|nr:hypothetical protein Pint_18341 [Pistacia integerrima]
MIGTQLEERLGRMKKQEDILQGLGKLLHGQRIIAWGVEQQIAPIHYAQLAASQVSQFMKFDEMSDTSSSQGGLIASGDSLLSELTVLHDNVRRSMFFC